VPAAGLSSATLTALTALVAAISVPEADAVGDRRIGQAAAEPDHRHRRTSGLLRPAVLDPLVQREERVVGASATANRPIRTRPDLIDPPPHCRRMAAFTPEGR
jgi:hypothetical protein